MCFATLKGEFAWSSGPDNKQIKIDLNVNYLFMWDMEEFKAVRAPEEEKVTIISMYLTGDAKENPDGAGQTA